MSVRSSGSGRRASSRGLLPYIAVFKFLKTMLLVVVALAAFGFVSPSASGVVEAWLARVTSPTGRRFVERVLTLVLRLEPGALAAIGIGALCYAALFLTEGVGLWRGRRWAEYLTVVATGSFIPFEVYELAREVTVSRLTALVLNVAIVVYLIARLRGQKGQSRFEISK